LKVACSALKIRVTENEAESHLRTIFRIAAPNALNQFPQPTQFPQLTRSSQRLTGTIMEILAKLLQSEPLQAEAWQWFGIGLGLAFVITIGVIILFFCHSAFFDKEDQGIDTGFLGLILLLVTILYLVAFSFLIAASAKGLDVKVLIALVDAFVLVASKLLAPEFLRYLNDEPIGGQADKPSSEAGAKIAKSSRSTN
jgi:hypothetical protein